MDVKIIYKKAQVAIWVILAVVLAASIILFFTLGQDKREVNILEPGQIDFVNAPSFMQICTEKIVLETVDVMLPQGGFVSPTNVVKFNNTYIAYVCKNEGFYEPCINQHPMLLSEMKNEIKENISPSVEKCFDDLKKEVEKRGGSMNFGDLEIEIDFAEDKVFVKLNREVSIEKKGAGKKYERFDIVVDSPVYNLGMIVMEIALQEAKYCNFENAGFSMAYPRYKVSKYTMSFPTRIYIIEDEKTGKVMMTAVRGCAGSAGL